MTDMDVVNTILSDWATAGGIVGTQADGVDLGATLKTPLILR